MKVIIDQAHRIQQWYNDNNLLMNYSKTKYQIFHKFQNLIPSIYDVPIKLNNGQLIERVNSFKYLGVHLDSNLNFPDHFNVVSEKVSNKLGFFHGVKRHLTEKVMAVMINSHIHSVMDYCIDIWAIHTDAQLDTIQRKVNSFLIKFLFPSFVKKFRHRRHSRFKVSKNEISINDLLLRLKLLTIRERRDLFLYKYAFKNLRSLKSVSSTRRTWPLLIVPTLKFAQKSINYRAIQLWNKLPRNWDPNMSYNVYVQSCRELIINNRGNQFYYFLSALYVYLLSSVS